MRRDRPPRKTRAPAPAVHAPQGAVERAHSLLLRIETDGPNPVTAAEEVDRLQARLARDGKLAELIERVASLCEAWAVRPLRTERGRAWMTLVGAFDLKEHGPQVAEMVRDAGLQPALRVQAARVLPRLLGSGAARTLLEVVRSPTDTAVRAAAAESLGDLGERSLRGELEELLDEELPLSVWTAVSAAIDRFR